MKLELENIGLIKKADIKLDGLTVIAGENDSGKSTVGKALYAILRAKTLSEYSSDFKQRFDFISKRIFKEQVISNNSVISIEDNLIDFYNNEFKYNNNEFLNSVLIETPLIWNLYDFFQNVAQLAPLSEGSIRYPYIFWDLFTKLSNERDVEYAIAKLEIENITKIIGGDFIHIRENFKDKYVYKKSSGEEVELENVAMGIKSFGTILVLLKNNYITKKRILIFDEPEVHLHPKWQLEMAKLLVNLVKNGVKIVVNSHSPYMIEALKRYSDLEDIEEMTNFYLAEDGDINLQNSLENIFEKLAIPMRRLKEMKIKKYLNENN